MEEPNEIRKRESVVFEELDHEPSGWLETTLTRVGSSTEDFFKKNSSSLGTVLAFVLNGLVIGYFTGCLYYYIEYITEPLYLCSGFGSLIAFLGIVYFFVIYFLVVKRYFGGWLSRNVYSRISAGAVFLWKYAWFRWGGSLALLAGIVVFLVLDTTDAPERLVSLLGIAVLLLLGFAFSSHPGRVAWRPVASGLLLQFLFALLFIRWDPGRIALQCFSDKDAFTKRRVSIFGVDLYYYMRRAHRHSNAGIYRSNIS